MIQKSTENRLVLVLDTNVCLDLFIFHDPRWDKLLSGLLEKKLVAITKKSCRDEWLAVLHYKQLPVNDDNRSAIIRAFDNLIRCVDSELLSPIAAVAPTSVIKLPICTDPDDQQFMELARDFNATHLITKDKALLKCAKRVAQYHSFKIFSPEIFLKTVVF
ncbi:MAG: hypothetical protein K0R08_969 [Solimicrobium sp.]|jgi:putative PIN family toxin of toxin-antitoxin system|nr:hypothetical protein [Solimicrobium sp.]